MPSFIFSLTMVDSSFTLYTAVSYLFVALIRVSHLFNCSTCEKKSFATFIIIGINDHVSFVHVHVQTLLTSILYLTLQLLLPWKRISSYVWFFILCSDRETVLCFLSNWKEAVWAAWKMIRIKRPATIVRIVPECNPRLKMISGLCVSLKCWLQYI